VKRKTIKTIRDEICELIEQGANGKGALASRRAHPPAHGVVASVLDISKVLGTSRHRVRYWIDIMEREGVITKTYYPHIKEKTGRFPYCYEVKR